MQLIDRFRCRTEFRPAVDDVNLLRQLGQAQRPIDGGIAAAGNHHPLAAEILPALHQIENRGVFVVLDAGQRRTVGSEGAAAGGDDNRLGVDLQAFGRRDAPTGFALPCDGRHLLPQLIDRIEGGRLGLQLGDQILCQDLGIGGNVIDRLFGVERTALPAGDLESIDHLTGHFQHATFENGEEADRPCANDGDVSGFDGHQRVAPARRDWAGANLAMPAGLCKPAISRRLPENRQDDSCH